MAPKQNLNLEEIKHTLENQSGYPFELEIVRRIKAYRNSAYIVEPSIKKLAGIEEEKLKPHLD
jgi:hypothetical protein